MLARGYAPLFSPLSSKPRHESPIPYPSVVASSLPSLRFPYIVLLSLRRPFAWLTAVSAMLSGEGIHAPGSSALWVLHGSCDAHGPRSRLIRADILPIQVVMLHAALEVLLVR
jgi:hypothetical protein